MEEQKKNKGTDSTGKYVEPSKIKRFLEDEERTAKALEEEQKNILDKYQDEEKSRKE